MSTTQNKAPHNPRMFDDAGFLEPGQRRAAPQATGDLLSRMGLRKSSASEKEAGIRKWLATHEASPNLAKSLRRSDFGFLLDEPR